MLGDAAQKVFIIAVSNTQSRRQNTPLTQLANMFEEVVWIGQSFVGTAIAEEKHAGCHGRVFRSNGRSTFHTCKISAREKCRAPRAYARNCSADLGQSPRSSCHAVDMNDHVLCKRHHADPVFRREAFHQSNRRHLGCRQFAAAHRAAGVDHQGDVERLTSLACVIGSRGVEARHKVADGVATFPKKASVNVGHQGEIQFIHRDPFFLTRL